MEINLSTEANFRISLIEILVNEINEESMCLYPIVTKLEVTQFLNRWLADLNIIIAENKKTYGINKMDDVFYFTKEEFKRRYFNDILKYVHFDKKNFSEENTSINKYGKN